MNNLDVDALIVKHFRFCHECVTAIVQPNQIWFDAEDVCRLMGYRNSQQAVKSVSDGDRLKLNYWDVQKRIPILLHEVWGYHTQLNHYFINEFGVTKLLSMHLWSLNRTACNWLVNHVIPSVVPTNNEEINNRYRHHKHYLMRFSWKMIKAE